MHVASTAPPVEYRPPAHEPDSAGPAAKRQYLPCVHWVHVAAPLAENVPAGHWPVALLIV